MKNPASWTAFKRLLETIPEKTCRGVFIFAKQEGIYIWGIKAKG